MFQIIMLVCAIGISPSDCDPNNAISYTAGPQVRNEIMCLHQGETGIATTAVKPQQGEYLKVVCQRLKNN